MELQDTITEDFDAFVLISSIKYTNMGSCDKIKFVIGKLQENNQTMPLSVTCEYVTD